VQTIDRLGGRSLGVDGRIRFSQQRACIRTHLRDENPELGMGHRRRGSGERMRWLVATLKQDLNPLGRFGVSPLDVQGQDDSSNDFRT